jgi:hypothetical protein
LGCRINSYRRLGGADGSGWPSLNPSTRSGEEFENWFQFTNPKKFWQQKIDKSSFLEGTPRKKIITLKKILP